MLETIKGGAGGQDQYMRSKGLQEDVTVAKKFIGIRMSP